MCCKLQSESRGMNYQPKELTMTPNVLINMGVAKKKQDCPKEK